MTQTMSFELDPWEGEYLIRLARESINRALNKTKKPTYEETPEKLRTPCGVFVTLNKIHGSSHRLRGCIGYPYPIKPLVEAVSEVAVSAAQNDPRFDPVNQEE